MHEKTVSKIKSLLSKSLAKRLPDDIKVVLIDRLESERLNFIYKEKRKPTNVLSFCYPQLAPGEKKNRKSYGEILICPDIVKKEAFKQGNSQTFQMTWMILHGILHLSGIHHEQSRAESRRFVRLEQKIMENFL